MLHTITDSEFTAKILNLGAELKSYRNEVDGEEYIWGGDPKIWKCSHTISDNW
jgi:hypothetical protein